MTLGVIDCEYTLFSFSWPAILDTTSMDGKLNLVEGSTIEF